MKNKLLKVCEWFLFCGGIVLSVVCIVLISAPYLNFPKYIMHILFALAISMLIASRIINKINYKKNQQNNDNLNKNE